MKRLITLIAVPLVFGCADDSIDDRVEAAERARATAIAAQDVDAYRQLMDDDLLIVDQRGELITKDDRSGTIGSGEARNTRRSESTVEVRRYGDVALVMGQSVWQSEGRENHDYFTRIWVSRGSRWRMVGGHYTDITDQVTDKPSRFKLPDNPVPALPIASRPPPQDAEAQVLRAIGDQHRAYWAKDPERYRQFAASDLLRIAENGVRTREELINGMQANARLPAPPSDQLDVRVRIYGNVAVTTCLDQGTDIIGRLAKTRFTVVFVRRDPGWQMVHIQSTGVKERRTGRDSPPDRRRYIVGVAGSGAIGER
jgi:ketosteroid isomerase-like protein